MRTSKFLKRIQVALEIIFKTNKYHACFMNCPKCGSINIQPLPAELDRNSDERAERLREKMPKCSFAWSGQAYCHSCGSICTEFQYWEYSREERE